MDYREKILEFIKIKGPVLPVQIAKEIGSNILMASAHLAELTASGRLKVSSIKVGGSPLYFLQGQEAMLEKFAENMNDKEKKAFDLLNQSKILRDSEQEPVIRVALREIKDFAVPLNVNYDSNKEIFWKWHIMGDDEAESIIKEKLHIFEKPIDSAKMQSPTAFLPDEKRSEEEKLKNEEISKEEKMQKEYLKKSEPLQKQLKEKFKEPAKETRRQKPRDKYGNFLKEVMDFFEKNKINVLSSEIIKKDSEIDFIIEIPSVVGNLQHYCKAKSKKRISDADLSNAYVKAQFKKLPVLFLSNGELSAKAQEMIGKELGNLNFKRI